MISYCFEEALASTIDVLRSHQIIKRINEFKPTMFLFGGCFRYMIEGCVINNPDVMVVSDKETIESIINMLTSEYRHDRDLDYTPVCHAIHETEVRVDGSRFNINIFLAIEGERPNIDFTVNTLAVKIDESKSEYGYNRDDLIDIREIGTSSCQSREKIGEAIDHIRRRKLVPVSSQWKLDEIELLRIGKMCDRGYHSNDMAFAKHVIDMCYNIKMNPYNYNKDRPYSILYDPYKDSLNKILPQLVRHYLDVLATKLL